MATITATPRLVRMRGVTWSIYRSSFVRMVTNTPGSSRSSSKAALRGKQSIPAVRQTHNIRSRSARTLLESLTLASADPAVYRPGRYRVVRLQGCFCVRITKVSVDARWADQNGNSNTSRKNLVIADPQLTSLLQLSCMTLEYLPHHICGN